MIKKLTLALSLVAVFANYAYAAQSTKCDYNDTFYVNNTSSPASSMIIGNVNLAGDGKITNQSLTSFTIHGTCGPTIRRVSVTATFGTSTENSCTLTIKDGEFYMDPVVETINCKGNYTYTGITYDGVGTYNYKLHFATK